MATRLERLEESLVKAQARIPEIEANIAEELAKVEARRDAEVAKFLEQKAKFEKLYGSLTEDQEAQLKASM